MCVLASRTHCTPSKKLVKHFTSSVCAHSFSTQLWPTPHRNKSLWNKGTEVTQFQELCQSCISQHMPGKNKPIALWVLPGAEVIGELHSEWVLQLLK